MTTAGPLYTGTQANDNTVGNFPWNSPTSAATDNGTYTTSNVTNTFTSNRLKVTNFGFSLGAGVTSIDGITVEIKKRKTGAFGNNRDLEVILTKTNSASVGSDKSDTATNWPTTAAYSTYGGVSDLWGTTWSQSDIESSNFGVWLRAAGADTNFSQAEIDTVRITITYTATAPTSVANSLMMMGCGT